MLTLADLTPLNRPSETVIIGGKPLELCALVSSERQEVLASWPRPTPPLLSSLKGGQARDHDAPSHRAAMQQWNSGMTTGFVAIALDYHTADGAAFPWGKDAAIRRAWIEAAAEELGRVLTDDAIEGLHSRLMQLERSQFGESERIGTETKQGN